MVARRSHRLATNVKQLEAEAVDDSDDEIEQYTEADDDDDESEDEERYEKDMQDDDEGDNDDDNEDVDDEEEDEGDEDDDENDESEDEDDDHDEDEDDIKPVTIKPLVSATGEQCTFDLLNLLAVNSHQLEVSKLHSQQNGTASQEMVTIPGETMPVSVNEELLLAKATDGCTQLIHALWQLPTERSDAGPLIILPGFSETKLPRQLPPPPPKKETKWEKFAKERGMPLNKNKRSQKVWDETAQEWKFRHGYNKANNDSKEWPIMEVGGNDDPFEDPWERMRDAKRGRVEKNMVNRMKNEEKAGTLPKGTANRTIKSLEKTRTTGKEGGNADRDLKIPVGVPVDLQARKGSAEINSLKRGRENTQKALLATQRSTASLGKFDGMRAGEPERRKVELSAKKRKFESATDKKVIASEADRGLKVLDAVMNGGGKERDKAKRKGTLAKGETAYDYDFNDGLGPSTFRKKKGRAGAGKMKKMTKKRSK